MTENIENDLKPIGHNIFQKVNKRITISIGKRKKNIGVRIIFQMVSHMK